MRTSADDEIDELLRQLFEDDEKKPESEKPNAKKPETVIVKAKRVAKAEGKAESSVAHAAHVKAESDEKEPDIFHYLLRAPIPNDLHLSCDQNRIQFHPIFPWEIDPASKFEDYRERLEQMKQNKPISIKLDIFSTPPPSPPPNPTSPSSETSSSLQSQTATKPQTLAMMQPHLMTPTPTPSPPTPNAQSSVTSQSQQSTATKPNLATTKSHPTASSNHSLPPRHPPPAQPTPKPSTLSNADLQPQQHTTASDPNLVRATPHPTEPTSQPPSSPLTTPQVQPPPTSSPPTQAQPSTSAKPSALHSSDATKPKSGANGSPFVSRLNTPRTPNPLPPHHSPLPRNPSKLSQHSPSAIQNPNFANSFQFPGPPPDPLLQHRRYPQPLPAPHPTILPPDALPLLLMILQLVLSSLQHHGQFVPNFIPSHV